MVSHRFPRAFLMKAIDCFFRKSHISPIHTSSHFIIVLSRGFTDSLRSIHEFYGSPQSLAHSLMASAVPEYSRFPPQGHVAFSFMMLPHTTPACPIYLMNRIKPTHLLPISLRSPLDLSLFSPHTYRFVLFLSFMTLLYMTSIKK